MKLASFIFAAFSLFGVTTSFADVSNQGAVDSFLRLVRLNLININSISCHIKMYDKDESVPKSLLEWTESVAGYEFHLDAFDKTEQSIFSSSASSDVGGAMVAANRGEMLLFTKAARPVPSEIRNFQLPLTAFEFIYSQIATETNDPWSQTSLSILKRDNIWAGLKDKTVFLGEEVLDKQNLLVFMVHGGRDKFLNIPIKYEVYIDPSRGWFPVRWKAIDEADRVISEFKIIKFMPASKSEPFFPVPIASSISYYAVTPKDVKSTPINWQRFEYENVILNQSAESLMLDPASANDIFDIDTNTKIHVPR